MFFGQTRPKQRCLATMHNITFGESQTQTPHTNSEAQSILEPAVRPSVWWLKAGRHWVMQQLMIPSTAANLQQNVFKRKESMCSSDAVEVQTSTWLKSYLEKAVQEQMASNFNGLKQCGEVERAKTPSHQCGRKMKSHRKRLFQVIEPEGGSTNYWIMCSLFFTLLL